MGQRRGAIDQNLAERWCWPAAHRNGWRVARRLYRKQVVDGVYQLDQGALLDDFFYFLQDLGVVEWLNDVRSTAIQHEMVLVVPYVLLYSVKTLFGVDGMNALLPRCSVTRPSGPWSASRPSGCARECVNEVQPHGRGHAPRASSVRTRLPSTLSG